MIWWSGVSCVLFQFMVPDINTFSMIICVRFRLECCLDLNVWNSPKVSHVNGTLAIYQTFTSSIFVHRTSHISRTIGMMSWRRLNIGLFSVLLAIWKGNLLVVTDRFSQSVCLIIFVVSSDKLFNKLSNCCSLGTPWRSYGVIVLIIWCVGCRVHVRWDILYPAHFRIRR